MAREMTSPSPERPAKPVRKVFGKPAEYSPPNLPPDVPRPSTPPVDVPRISIVSDKSARPEAKTVFAEVAPPDVAESLVLEEELPEIPIELTELAPEAAEKHKPYFEAATNLDQYEGPAAGGFNADNGTFVFIAGEGQSHDQLAKAALDIKSDLGSIKDTAETGKQLLSDEIISVKESKINNALFSAVKRAEGELVVSEVAHLIARREKKPVEVPALISGKIIDDRITGAEFIGDLGGAEQISAIMEKGPDEWLKENTEETTEYTRQYEQLKEKLAQDFTQAFENKKKELTDWMQGRDPQSVWPTQTELNTALEQGQLDQNQYDRIIPYYELQALKESVFNYFHDAKSLKEGLESGMITQEQHDAIAPIFILEVNANFRKAHTEESAKRAEIARTLQKKVDDIRGRRLGQTEEQFEDSFADLAQDPELAALDPALRPLLLEKLKQPFRVSVGDAGKYPSPELSADLETRISEAKQTFSELLKEAADHPDKREDALDDLVVAMRNERMRTLFEQPATKLALMQALESTVRQAGRAGIRIPDAITRKLELEAVAVPENPAEAQRLSEPPLAEKDRDAVTNLIREYRNLPDPSIIRKDQRFLDLSRKGKYVLAQRLGASWGDAGGKADDLLRERKLQLAGEPGKDIAVMVIKRNGEVRKLNDKFTSKRAASTQYGELTHGLDVNTNSFQSLSEPLDPGDEIVIMPTQAVEADLFSKEQSVKGTEDIEQQLPQLARTDAGRISKKLGDISQRGHIVLRMPE